MQQEIYVAKTSLGVYDHSSYNVRFIIKADKNYCNMSLKESWCPVIC